MDRSVVELVGETDVEALSADQVVETILDALHPNVALACSFQKEESVLLDMLLEREPRARVFTLDSHVLFPETYELWRELERRYGIRIEVHEGPSLGRQAAIHGEALWERNPDLCCDIRKVEPNRRALEGKQAWISGIRRDQSDGRSAIPIVAWNEKFGVVKVNPLANWDEKATWAYIVAENIPYNPLLDHGYASIGCYNCTIPGVRGRAGRWDGFDKDECGLHT